MLEKHPVEYNIPLYFTLHTGELTVSLILCSCTETQRSLPRHPLSDSNVSEICDFSSVGRASD